MCTPCPSPNTALPLPSQEGGGCSWLCQECSWQPHAAGGKGGLQPRVGRGPAARVRRGCLCLLLDPWIPFLLGSTGTRWHRTTPPGLPQPSSECSASAFPQGSKGRRRQLLDAPPTAKSSCHCLKMSPGTPEHLLQDSFPRQGGRGWATKQQASGESSEGQKNLPGSPGYLFYALETSHPGLWFHTHYLS